jgi:DNA polymerase-3 subunit beta
MKLTLLKENLKEGLTAVGRVSQKNLSLPILNSVLLETEKNFLCLKATDLEIGIKWWLLAKVEKEGKTVCPLRFLQGFVESLPADRLTLRASEKKLWLEAEKTQAQINGQEAEEFPIIPEPETKGFFSVDSSAFVENLSRVVDFCAASMVKPEIAGVYFFSSGNVLKMVSTDSFRLAEKTVLLKENPSQDFSFILPQRSCRELLNIFGGKEGVSLLKVFFSNNQFLLESPLAETPHPQMRFFSRIIEGEYPNYQEIIPKEFRFKAVLSKNEFLQNLKTISLFSNKINEVRLKIDPSEKKIEFFGQNPEIGQSSSQMSADIEGEPSEVSFNWRFLADGLSQLKEKDIIFSLGKDEGPALLKPVQSQGYLYLLMPLRV